MRLADYDYSRPGVYFVTICTKGHQQLFGTIRGGETRLTDRGNIVRDTWEELPQRYPYVALDDFVVMPNHLHALLVINGDPKLLEDPPKKGRSLGQIIAAFKSLAAKRINGYHHTPGEPLWQRSYWDRIVRNDKELNRIREYILYNPSRWEVDRLNPDAEIRMNESVTNRKDIEWMV